MSKTLAAGTKISIAATYGAAKAMSAISNATSAVATLAASHAVAVADVVEVTSGWRLANGVIVRASAVATNDVTLESLDTSNTTDYPAGEGIGSVREILTWAEVTQIKKNISSSGGEQQYADTSELRFKRETRVPTTRTPISYSLPVYDDFSLAWVAYVKAASKAGTPCACKMEFPNGQKLYVNAYWGMSDAPGIEDSLLSNVVTLDFDSEVIRYVS